MQSVLSRPQILGGSGTGSSHHVPRRSSSFLSLRREKDKPPPPLDTFSTTFGSSGPPHGTYFDAYPRPKTTTNARSSKHKVRRVSPSTSSQFDPAPSHHEQWERPTGRKTSAEPSYAFPSFDSSEDLTTPTTPKPYPRTRSRTGPSGRSTWEETSPIPQLRFSGSSSTQYTETPPHTPIDINPSRDLFESFPVVVAAPISGVETMDALVDGMNGGDGILSSGMGMSNRARFGIHGHHPLYQPPLPTPPPGVVLGGGKLRRPKHSVLSHPSSDSGDGDEENPSHFSSRPRRRRTRPTTPRAASDSTTTPQQPARPLTTLEHDLPTAYNCAIIPHTSYTPPASDRRKSVIPSISEIIRTHAPPEALVRARPSTARSSSLYAHSQGHATVHEEPESEPEPLSREEEAEMISRSSIDSVADEVQRTLRNQVVTKPPPTAPPSSFLKRHSAISDNVSLYSPRSDPGVGTSLYSSSISSHHPSSPFDALSFTSLIKPPSPSQEVAQYLRSKRLTTLLKLTRSPHASQDNPLSVSLSDLGSQTGYPVVVFLGLGCVRHIMGLYDEMAECLNLRLITIDRWGLGRTEPRSKAAKGIMQWASVVEEVLDLLRIGQCSVMAHSAGAPYALSFANKLPSRIRGDVCLLAPWVGGTESNGYKWLKYVPNGILKTAQAAEWKVQAWMIGKPPTIAFEGIGYNAEAPTKPSPDSQITLPHPSGNLVVNPLNLEARPRPSIGSSSFSEYDDLGDFDGRFESRSTLGAPGSRPSPQSHHNDETKMFVTKRKTSRGFLDLLKGSSHSTQSPVDEKHQGGKKLKALRSMGSLKGRSHPSKKSAPPSPQLPPSLQIEVGLGFNDLNWTKSNSQSSIREPNPFTATPSHFPNPGPHSRSSGRRSISFTSPGLASSLPSTPSPSTTNSPFVNGTGPGSAYQATLGNALIAASHSESAKGTHNDLLQILNHENHPWGFSYTSYPHNVTIWYGDRDEKIAENAVRWMEHTMGEERCTVKVVKGADHGLMYRSSVVVEVLEQILAYWQPTQ
ncbi:hypothetical protein BDZ94DRAFT_1176320 [Collybia nuda]|uniref:Alpha/beta-hydrolase n=1 Tax=Collybia nuda TaxID=64659 RepID=A0A9P5XU73_9AGAR|nr:hypothetical protein BDZ94DRAFT_1176320 [Collybia nuda]